MKRLLTFVAMLLIMVGPAFGALTKTAAQVDEWAPVLEDAVREGAEIDCSLSYNTVVIVDIAITAADAHEGTQILVQISGSSSGDEDWVDVSKIVAVVGTANLETITNNPLAAASTTATVASTTGYTDDGTRFIFIEDQDADADSEMVMLISAVTDTSVTWLDGTANAHANTAVLSNIAERHTFVIPMSASRARIIYDNTYDGDGTAAEVTTHATVLKVTGV